MGLKRILLVAPIVLAIGGGAAAYFLYPDQVKPYIDQALGLKNQAVAQIYKLLGKQPPDPNAPPPPPDPNAPPVLGTYYSLPRIFATVNSPGHYPHVVQMQVGIFMHDPTDILWVQAYLPRIADAFQTYLRDDILMDKQHPIDVERMRRVLLERINKAIAPASITNVVVQTMVSG